MSRRLTVLVVAFALLIAVGAVPAWAYDELDPPTGKTCEECHGLDEGETGSNINDVRPRKGPHGGYSTGTQKCQTCHTVHSAPLMSVILLPAATIRDTCNSCHDGTGGKGVYGVLESQGVTVTAAHRVEETDLVPGGALAGTEETRTFSADGLLTCSDCHSPHDNNTVEPFTGDRIRESEAASFPADPPSLAVKTNRLLKQRPTSATTDTPVYGSDWCGACHTGRLYGSAGAYNHPVETQTAGVHYDNIVRVTGPNTSNVQTGTLGASNYGYVMPTSTPDPPGRRYPICQQCHEDARSVGNDPAQPQRISTLNGYDEEFSITAADGLVATDSPRFQVFPHESGTPRLLVENTDSLCTNCHDPQS